MDASYPSPNDWVLDPVLSGANRNEEEYNFQIVRRLPNANLAGYTDSSITGVSFMDSWPDGGVTTVAFESCDFWAICEQAQYNNGYESPPAEVGFRSVNRHNQEIISGTIGPVLPYDQEENL